MSMFLRVALMAAALFTSNGGAFIAALMFTAAPAVAQSYGPPDLDRSASVAVRQARIGPLPVSLTLDQALEEAEARSPAIVAAEAELAAAQGRLRQAGLRPNPELSVEIENFAGSGAYSGFNGSETTVSINQRLDLGGRRSARINVAQASFAAQEIQLAISRAELAQSVRTQFGLALATQARLELADANLKRAHELARIADELVAAGREPPLRAFRARANAAQAEAALQAAEAEVQAARRSLAALLGSVEPIGEIKDGIDYAAPLVAEPQQTLDVRLAEADLLIAQGGLREEQATRRVDPSVGVGMRRIEETGDRAFVASVAVPLPFFDRNQGNIAAARAGIRAAVARRDAAISLAASRIGNARTGFDAARARVGALEKVATPQAAEAMRLADLAYRAGRLSLIELLDAQEAFAAAQAELIDAHFALVEARAALARAAAQ